MTPRNASPAAPATHPLIVKRDALIVEHDAITGTDQSSVAKRAGKVRAINIVQLDLTLDGVPFEKWVSPSSVRTSKGSPSVSDADLIAEVLRLSGFVADETNDADMRAVADTRLRSKVRTAKDRGLVTTNEGGSYTGLTDTGAKVAPDAPTDTPDADAPDA